MIRIHWQGEDLEIDRLVFRPDSSEFDADNSSVARRIGLPLADDTADPLPGDFWVGCWPPSGWGTADHRRIGWASRIEAPLALSLLLEAGSRARSVEGFATLTDNVISPVVIRF